MFSCVYVVCVQLRSLLGRGFGDIVREYAWKNSLFSFISPFHTEIEDFSTFCLRVTLMENQTYTITQLHEPFIIMYYILLQLCMHGYQDGNLRERNL